MRDVPNPARKLLDKEVAAARAELAKLEQEYGSAAIDNEESRRPTMRGFKIANGKDGRAFLRTAVRQTGSLLVDGDNVTVRLDPMSGPRYTNALRALCEELNAMNPVFPETRYRLRYEVAPHPTSDNS